MSSRVNVLALSLLATCVLAACKPAPAPSESGAAPAAATPTSTAATVATPPTPGRIAADVDRPSDPRDAVKTSMERFLAVRSYHATMDFAGGPGGAMGHHEIDFVAPDRFRMQTPMGTQVIIGDTMHMQVRGRTMKLPLPKGTLTQWRDPARLAQSEAGMTVQAQGRDTIAGVPARKYLVHHEQPTPMDITLWIDGDALPVQVQVASVVQGKTVTSTTRYSRFNDPTIEVQAGQ